MQAFWQQMTLSWPVSAPEPYLAEALGDGVVGTLDALRLLHREPLPPRSRYPCDGCPRGRLVGGGPRSWAVCSCDDVACDPVDVSDIPSLTVHGPTLVDRLREVLELDGPRESVRWNRVARLGQRRIGVEGVVFGLVPRPSCVSVDNMARWLSLVGGELCVLLAPTRNSMPLTPQSSRVVWLALEDLVDLQAGTADLSQLVLRVPIAGVDLGLLLWPRFWLVIDHDRVSYAGQSLNLERKPRALAMLRVLADNAGRWVSRRDLMLAVYPDEITNRGRLLTDAVKLERRLRQLVSELGKAFATVDPRALPANPIENLRSRSDLEGGYRLAVGAGDVFLRE